MTSLSLFFFPAQNPRLLDEGTTERPDYQRCIAISTRAALKYMVPPGALVMLAPLVAGTFFGVMAVCGLLTGKRREGEGKEGRFGWVVAVEKLGWSAGCAAICLDVRRAAVFSCVGYRRSVPRLAHMRGCHACRLPWRIRLVVMDTAEPPGTTWNETCVGCVLV